MFTGTTGCRLDDRCCSYIQDDVTTVVRVKAHVEVHLAFDLGLDLLGLAIVVVVITVYLDVDIDPIAVLADLALGPF